MSDDARPDRSGERERWKRASELFGELVELPEAERASRLGAHAGDDPELLEVVGRMLEADASDGDILERGVSEAARLLIDDAPVLSPGDLVGGFEIIGELGRGGMGVVYEARDVELGRPAALKFLPSSLASSLAETDRLLTEAKTASRLDHPNVATIYQVGETADGRRFIAMPRYVGETLRDRLDGSRLSPREVVAIARQVAAALCAAHRAGIVHRDVTPANIFLTEGGPVKLLDFGLSALAGSARSNAGTRGTVAYMSPEHARGDRTDPRSDVWSLGVVVFRMLSGELPYSAPSAAEMMERICGPEPAPSLAARPGVDLPLASIVDRALRKNPDERFADAGDMLAALERLAATRGRSALAWHRRSRVGAGVALALLASWLLVTFVGSRGPTPQVIPTLVALPVSAAGGDGRSAELAAGIVDEVTARLTALGRVQVIQGGEEGSGRSARSANRFVFRVAVDSRTEAPLLTATVTGANGHRIWEETRPFSRAVLRGLSTDIADGVLRAIGVDLSPRERAALFTGFPATVESHEAFLTGNRLLRLRSPAAVVEAIDQYRLAYELDSNFTAAIARHAYAVALMLDWGWMHPQRSREELLSLGVALSQRAVTLDSNSAEAWLARAYIMVIADPVRMAGASEAFRHAIALDPYNAEAFHQYGQTQMLLGRFADAMTAYRRATELDPASALSLIAMGGLVELEGRRAETRRLIDSAVLVAPRMAYARAIRSLVHSYDGDYVAAELDAGIALRLDSTFIVPAHAVLAIARAGRGDAAGARESIGAAMQAMADSLSPTPDEAHLVASALVEMGELEAAAAVVARARPRGAALWYVLQHPRLAALRAHPLAAAALAEADARRLR